MTPSMVLLLLSPLIIWRFYSRIRRLTVRQRSKAWRHWSSATLFPLLILTLAWTALGKPLALTSLLAAAVAGIGLAIWGLKLTRFETTEQGYFYTPNAHIGIALSLLFAGRLVFRIVNLYGADVAGAPKGLGDFAKSPLTLLVFGLLAGYYAAYAIGVLRWRRAQARIPT